MRRGTLLAQDLGFCTHKVWHSCWTPCLLRTRTYWMRHWRWKCSWSFYNHSSCYSLQKTWILFRFWTATLLGSLSKVCLKRFLVVLQFKFYCCSCMSVYTAGNVSVCSIMLNAYRLPCSCKLVPALEENFVVDITSDVDEHVWITSVFWLWLYAAILGKD